MIGPDHRLDTLNFHFWHKDQGSDDRRFDPTDAEQGLLFIWDAETGARLIAIQDNRALQTMNWNKDESQILAIGIQGVRQYYTHLEDLITLGCERVNRNLTEGEWSQFFSDDPYRATCPDMPIPEE
ncbi:MAG: hypothetical protein KDI02_02480 [Anaerolineae bacterium]|nr:hypothetical protein [Anaerolineae bacterium]